MLARKSSSQSSKWSCLRFHMVKCFLVTPLSNFQKTLLGCVALFVYFTLPGDWVWLERNKTSTITRRESGPVVPLGSALCYRSPHYRTSTMLPGLTTLVLLSHISWGLGYLVTLSLNKCKKSWKAESHCSMDCTVVCFLGLAASVKAVYPPSTFSTMKV